MLWLRKLLARLGIVTLQPHEKAQLGLIPWGRQSEPGGSHITATAKGKTSLKARVYRAATNTWEDLGVL